MNENLIYAGIFVGIALATVVLGFFINRFFARLIRKSSKEMNSDPTNYQFLRRALVVIIYLVGFSLAIYTMPKMRALANSLLAGAGILAIAVGFASQHALGNIISGFFIVIFKPFRVNDRIKFNQIMGTIEDITLRHVVIRDFENNRIIIPNSIISNEVLINLDIEDHRTCRWINIGISYDSDLVKAKEIIRDEILKHPFFIDHRTPQQIEDGVILGQVRVVSLGDSSVNLRGWAWARNIVDAFMMECDLLESIKLRFDREGIEIPFPHRTIVQKELKSMF